VSSAPPPLDSEGDRLWHEVETVFADPARHDRFVHHCGASGTLPAAARRYRDWLVAHPDEGDDQAAADRVVASKMIQRITFLALQPLAQAARPVRKRFGRGTLALVVLLAALVGAALGAFSGAFSGSARPSGGAGSSR